MIAVIGDVHGCFLTLEKLVEQIKTKYPDIDLYCVGDLVDRGNFSYEVLEFVKDNNIIFTPGNHDYMFYYHIKEPTNPIGKPWIYNGCEPTLKSYLGRWEKMNDHLDMIKSAPLIIDHPDCFISHAGISKTFDEILQDNLLKNPQELDKLLRLNIFNEDGIHWNRVQLLNIGKLQVIGHTHRKEIYFDKLANALYIDTTAYGKNKLSAVITHENELVEVIDQKTCSEDVHPKWICYS